MGYILAFGAVLVKMWRVYHIFKNPHPNKKVEIILIVLVYYVCIISVIYIDSIRLETDRHCTVRNWNCHVSPSSGRSYSRLKRKCGT